MSAQSACRYILLISAALAPLCLTGPAWAQAAKAAGGAAQGGTGVQELVVTASRREQALSKVPLSVSAFTAKTMDIKGVKSFAQLAKFTPGVTYDQDRHDVSIRGVVSKAGSGTTGVYIDDTPIQVRALGLNANNTLPAVFDLDRVEVLRGPQGTLFGAGSEGGTVRYITHQPSLTHFSGQAHGEFAFTQDGAPSWEAGAASGGPIVQDKLGFRVSAWGRRDGGFIDRVDYLTGGVTDRNSNWVDTYALRGALSWSPVPELLITPGIDYQNRYQHNYDNYWLALSNPDNGVFRTGTPDRQPDKDWFYLPTLKVEYDFPAVKVISDTSYYKRLERVGGYSGTLYNLSYFQQLTAAGTDPQLNDCVFCYGPEPLLLPTGPNLPGFGRYVSANLITNRQSDLSQEFRLQSADANARLTWTVGGFFSHNNQRSTEEIIDPQLPALTQYLWGEDMITAWGQDLLPNGDDYLNSTKSTDRQFALFADATFKLTDQLKLNAGLRYAWTHFDYSNITDGAQNVYDNGGFPQYATGGKNENPLTPKFGVTYQATSDDLFYATAAKGYRIGGATPPLPIVCGPTFPSSYNSDTVWSYEAGTKDKFLNKQLAIQLSAFYLKWKNIQQAIYVPACGIQYTTNVGDAVSEGFDFQAQYYLTADLEVDMSVGYTDAHYSGDAIDPLSGAVLALKGDSLDIVPWSVSVGVQYNFSLAGKDAFARVDYEYQSKRTKPTPEEDPGTTYFDPGLVPNPATNFVSLRAGLTVHDVDLALFMDNVFNARPQLDLNHQDSNTLLFEATTFRPRTIGLSLNYRY
jgi:outer membrane receptor protein involved in Fe transport